MHQAFIATSLHNLDIQMHIGVSKDEQSRPQRIRISFKMYQLITSECCRNDDTDDYICYAKLSEVIKEYCESRTFRLIEYLCFQVHQLLKKTINKQHHIYVQVEKLDLQLADSNCIAKCEYSDF